VCGAYEAVAMEKPFVLSDTEALKCYFYQGGVHVANNGEAIAKGIQQIISEYESYMEKVAALKAALESSWTIQLKKIEPDLFGR
jgi:glycosyltransferase involved in cell wall biosynthesis